ncbi:MAG: aminotransferase class I/II-fold pyridoxal phosphate-dependent enzyme [Nanoarchaeota archaeon]|nr:aminotransferase class I/II-fold pyridoxal phosphate-dependent enzyme [Nanoarchaeota archaeon]
MARQDYRISFGDLKVSERAKEYVKDALDTNYVSGGPRVREFEDGWGILFGHKYSVAMSNGTAANTAACMALYDFGATRGDEIIAPALAFAAVGNSIMQAGFEPAFVDIRRDTMNIDSDLIERRINNKTRAIIAVHTMGKPCDMERIMEIAKEYDLKVIEDCCEAYGGTYSGRYNGTIGDLSTSSFYVAHIISCGDGGMVSTSDPEIESVLRSIKDHGRRPGSMYFDHERHGANFRMNALTA